MTSEPDPTPSVTDWIVRLRSGDREATEHIWLRFARRVRALARQRLRTRRLEDEEDITQSVMHAICRGLEEGRLDGVANRDQLWRVCAVVTCRRVARTTRRAVASPEVGESELASPDPLARVLEGLQSDPPEAGFVSGFVAGLEELVEELEPWLRPIVLARLAGFTNAEIATREKRSVKTIERYLAMAREQWAASA